MNGATDLDYRTEAPIISSNYKTTSPDPTPNIYQPCPNPTVLAAALAQGIRYAVGFQLWQLIVTTITVHLFPWPDASFKSTWDGILHDLANIPSGTYLSLVLLLASGVTIATLHLALSLDPSSRTHAWSDSAHLCCYFIYFWVSSGTSFFMLSGAFYFLHFLLLFLFFYDAHQNAP